MSDKRAALPARCISGRYRSADPGQHLAPRPPPAPCGSAIAMLRRTRSPQYGNDPSVSLLARRCSPSRSVGVTVKRDAAFPTLSAPAWKPLSFALL